MPGSPERRAPQEYKEQPKPPEKPRAVPEQKIGAASQQEKEKRDYDRTVSRLEGNVEQTASTLIFGEAKVDAAMKERVVNALIKDIENIPVEKRQELIKDVGGRLSARVQEAQDRRLRPEEIRSRQIALDLLKAIESKLFVELPGEEEAIELTEEAPPEEGEMRGAG